MARPDARARARQLAFLVSFTQLLLPFAGLILLGGAVDSTGVLGPYGSAILTDLIGVLVIVFLSMWLAGRLYPRSGRQTGAFQLPPDRWPAARRLIVWIGGLRSVSRVWSRPSAAFPRSTPATQGVLLLPVYLLLAYLFIRVARLLRARSRSRAGRSTDEATGFR